MEEIGKSDQDEHSQKQMVDLYNAGKSRTEIVQEYELTASALDRWITRINKTGSAGETAQAGFKRRKSSI